MLSHSDNVEASGFVQHLKLPHYVDFQSELELVRRLRAEHGTAGEEQREDRNSNAGTDHDQQEQAA
jgi:alpha-D-ribose 1-methylphosphonate 5-triphosphate synthase subunit PhnI